jgi:hypothetical protein
LLQRAIRRFYRRSLSFSTNKTPSENIGEELVVELTQAGYLPNNTISQATAGLVSQAIHQYMYIYWQLRHTHVSRDEAMQWATELLSIETEELLHPHAQHGALAQVGYQHYVALLPRDPHIAEDVEHHSYEISLYIAVHLALLKSDLAIVRHDLMRMYQINPQHLPAFIEFNRTVTTLYTSQLTQRLKRSVSKYGAPFRILKAMIDDGTNLPMLLQDKEQFEHEYQQQISKEYRDIKRRLNKGIIKSIIFIFITKVIIGVGIEVPYDLIVHHYVAFIPLAINLLFPPAYMAILRLGLKVPGTTNAHALRNYIDKALFTNEAPLTPAIRNASQHVSFGSKLLYGILFLVPFAITVYILHLMHFNIVQGIIFFVFLSTASFLGFRLSLMVRDLEIVTKQSGFLTSLRDFFYLPFILVGQWLSSKYAKVNAVGYFLDIAIELPLKTVLRLLRQWTRFLNEKHDEIY